MMAVNLAAEGAMSETLRPRLAGRIVALVGNAKSLAGTALGRDIDACDLVVRLNAAPGCGGMGQGSRTDWLASSQFLAGSRLRALAPERLLWMSPKRRLLAVAAFGWRLPLLFYPRRWWHDLSAQLGGARPSTGLMTIDLLERVGGPAEIRLFGFDFFQTASLSARKLTAPPPHDFARERAHVLERIREGRRIRLMTSDALRVEASACR